jgi:hypothetical protein
MVSKNKEAEELLGLRKKGTSVFQPVELGYVCPICNTESEDLRFSEYNGFLWCPKCDLDIPSCLCKKYPEPNISHRVLPKRIKVEEMTRIFLKTIKDAIKFNENKK